MELTYIHIFAALIVGFLMGGMFVYQFIKWMKNLPDTEQLTEEEIKKTKHVE